MGLDDCHFFIQEENLQLVIAFDQNCRNRDHYNQPVDDQRFERKNIPPPRCQQKKATMLTPFRGNAFVALHSLD